MRTTFLAILVMTSYILAQDKPVATASAIAAGCGSADAKFEVKTDSKQHPVAQPESGKALLYFIEDDTGFLGRPRPTTRLGVDGNWAGANHGSSYFYVSVEPGEHHLCASWQSTVVLGAGHKTAATRFTAQAGNAYFFRVRNSWSQYSVAQIDFNPVDGDEAQLLMSKFSFSTSHPKK